MSSRCGPIRRPLLIVAALLLPILVGVGCGEFERGEPTAGGAESAAPGEATAPTAATDAVSFSEQVLPVLMDACAQCHAEGGSASGTAFALSGDAESDLPGVRDLVDPSQPAMSRLLVKGTGEVAHGGGALLDSDSEEYQLIFSWIAAETPP